MTEEIKNSPLEDFDWEAYANGETKGEKSREELTKTYDESLNTVRDKDVIEGTIISLNKREAVVNIGYKSDGIIPMSEVRYTRAPGSEAISSSLSSGTAENSGSMPRSLQ